MTLLPRGADDNAEWTQLYSGRHHRAALTKKGELYTWGLNYSGQLGHGDKMSRDIPTKVVLGLDGFVIIKIFCGAKHMAALTDKGELLTWYVHPSPNCENRSRYWSVVFNILTSFFNSK